MAPALEARNLAKGFGGVPVLRDVSFSVEPGKLTVLAGENGAGKSTLMKIVTGQLRPNQGEVLIEGQPLGQVSPQHARAQGVGIVPQELAPYPDMLVYENLFVGRELRTKAGLLNRRAMISQARSMLEMFGVDIDPKGPMRHLSVALTQLVEIAKATTWGARVLLLDEPTSSIPDREVARLYTVVRQLKDQGVAMIYTTHRMAEIEELADQVIVLRDGNLVLDVPISKAPEQAIVHAMIGRPLDALFPQTAVPGSGIGLRVSGLTVERGGPAVDFTIRKGEILGLGGLVGAGRTEILEGLFGIRRTIAGTVEVDGRSVRRNAPAEAIRAGLAIVPEDRKGAGLVLSRSVLDNGSLPHLSSYSRGGWQLGNRRARVDEAMKSVALKSRGLDQLVGTLSGGNQQKVVLARWLTHNCSVLLLDEPTRGVDVGARGEIYAIIRDLAAAGLAVLLVSSDMPELIGLSHRVLVARAGGIAGELDRDQLDRADAQETIFRLASGQAPAGGVAA
ncbi:MULTISPECIES: sugar ABC transporter ATP-binding protein [Rhodococcus]|uniref:ABC transporter-like protein n=1 Tax=Rhodococcus opacus RKJ300 = JCM 13270 TaxID=1165867 RepID=I0WNN5_RHOOP|nr:MULTISPECIES: sugar ABC transporter ATP-binding protein [Rhodococcus]EID78001.1 ABC transporter-like protein [Rhodococcus opacus RKJ300 = JCM 13270]QQZ19527.1 sugar ABC transporter ATP-binding protein [Rhodococcus sp. 21391]